MAKNEKVQKISNRQIIVTAVGVVVILRLRKDVKNLQRDVALLSKSTGEIINYLHATHDTIYKTATMAQTIAAVK